MALLSKSQSSNTAQNATYETFQDCYTQCTYQQALRIRLIRIGNTCVVLENMYVCVFSQTTIDWTVYGLTGTRVHNAIATQM